jgi:hypothetical protein
MIRAALIAIALIASGTAHAKPREGDAILFSREGALWKVSARGGKPEKLIDLDARALVVDRIEASADGTVALVRAGRARRLVTLAVAGVGVRGVGCGVGGEGRELSWDGKRVTCMVDTDTDLVHEGGKRWTERVVERLPWLIGPGAQRAVAVEGDALVGFKLDARKARRILLPQGKPVLWSSDGQWLLVHWKDAACVIRAVGGNYKCFHGYTGVALATDGSYAVVAKKGTKGMDLFVGELYGAQTEAPVPLVRGADGPAAWLGQPGPAPVVAPEDVIHHEEGEDPE